MELGHVDQRIATLLCRAVLVSPLGCSFENLFFGVPKYGAIAVS